MKEIRLHGIGGQGTVKAGEMLVHAIVRDGKSGNSIPFFGFERQGAPVTSYVRLDEQKIRPKNQVYYPNCVIVIDSTVMQSQDVFEGIQEDTYFIINTDAQDINELPIPERVKHVAIVDGTKIALEVLKRDIPNMIMLAAFSRLTGWVSRENLRDVIVENFGENNGSAFDRGYDEAKVFELEGVPHEV